MSRTPKRDQAPARDRRALHRSLEEQRATLQGDTPRPTVGAPTKAERGTTLRERLPRAGLATLAEYGLEVGEHGSITREGRPVGQVREAWPGADAPFRVQPLAGLEFGKPRAVRSPTWAALVRMMPCAFCGKGQPLRAQLSLGRSQSELHHFPGRGPEAGGSDLETCPACSGCHGECTEHLISRARQAGAVERTMREILAGIREGWLQPGILLAVAGEAVLNR